uniref:BTB domain-containing protein n=1 Tax=Panagrolaimus davidi TaxID=227884 RepID=A0A914QDA4_9BILA
MELGFTLDEILNFLFSCLLFLLRNLLIAFGILLVFGVAFIKAFSDAFKRTFAKGDGTLLNNNHMKADLSEMEVIKLKIDGKCFEASAETLKRFDCFFSRMTESDLSHEFDEDGYIVIKRDATHFEEILKFMSTGEIEFPSDPYIVRCIKREADYYGLEDLIKECDKFLDGPAGRYEACLRAVFTTDERNAAIATKKPIVFLNVGVMNNVYAVMNDVKDNINKTITTGMGEFIRNRSRFPQFFFIIDYTHGTSLTMDFYFNGSLIKKLDIYITENNQCALNIEYQMSSAFTTVMAKMLDSAGIGRAVTEDGQLALTL